MWGEWGGSGLLLVLFSMSLSEESHMTTREIAVILSFFSYLIFAFLPIIPQPVWLGAVWIILSSICLIPVLLIPCRLSHRNHGFSDLREVGDDHEAQEIATESNREEYYLSISVVFCFPLYRVVYLLAAVGALDYGQTMGAFLLLTTFTKALFAATTIIASNIYSRTYLEAQMALSEDRNAVGVRSRIVKHILHQMQSPLHSLVTGLEQLGQRDHLNTSYLYLLSTMREASSFIYEILNDALLEAEGASSLTVGSFGLRKSISKVITSMLHSITTKGLEVEEDIPDSVPDRLIGDRRLLELVLRCLLGNAIEFSPNDSKIGLHVTSAALDSFTTITVSISDNGPGMSPEKSRKLFIGGRERSCGRVKMEIGTGAGQMEVSRLSLCKQMVGLQGGTLRVKKTEGQGSIFSVSIPFQTLRDEQNSLPGATDYLFSTAPADPPPPLPVARAIEGPRDWFQQLPDDRAFLLHSTGQTESHSWR